MVSVKNPILVCLPTRVETRTQELSGLTVVFSEKLL